MFRYPDKPTGVMHLEGLYPFEVGATGIYFAQAKIDGWRAHIEMERPNIVFTSRHGKPMPISDHVVAQFESRARMAFKPGTILDGEWCSRRPGARDEKIWLFDILRDGGTDLYDMGALERFELLRALGEDHFADAIVPYATSGFKQFFTSIAPDGRNHMPEAEGIVLKAKMSRYIGSVRESADNPSWTRCKWRAGFSGTTMVA